LVAAAGSEALILEAAGPHVLEFLQDVGRVAMDWGLDIPETGEGWGFWIWEGQPQIREIADNTWDLDMSGGTWRHPTEQELLSIRGCHKLWSVTN
jgi:hypothetical protein